MNEARFLFDQFEVDTARRLLLKNGEIISLSPKAFDLLLALMIRQGETISKNELLDKVWEGSFVEEKNLAVQIVALRKALGELKGENRFIATVPGKGYKFVAPLNISESKIVVETETLSRIIIETEEEIEDEPEFTETKLIPNGNRSALIVPVKTDSIFRQYRPIFLGFAVVLLVLLFAGSYYLGRYSLRRSNQNRTDFPFSEIKLKLLTDKGNINWAIISPDGKFFAYTLNNQGEFKLSLWLAQTDGSNEIQIRQPENALYRGLAFSSDSRTLYFSLNSKNQDLHGTLYRMPVLGGVPEKLLDDVGEFLSLSPNDKQIAFFRTYKDKNSSVLIIANLDGTGEREILTRPLNKTFSSNAPAWSPDGSMLAVGGLDENKHEEFFVINVADSGIKQLTTEAWRDIVNLVWQRDGYGLIAIAKEKGATDNQLWQIDYPSGATHRISHDAETYGFSLSQSADSHLLLVTQGRRESNIWVAPTSDLIQARQITFSSIGAIYGWFGLDWSPDGRIFFIGAKDQSRVIYAMDADGGNLKQITTAGFSDQKLTVTADGRLIVFQSNRSKIGEIWRVDSDGNNLRQLTTGGGNNSADVTPDGKWVYYLSTRENKSSIQRVSIEGSEPTLITDKDSFSPRISPDGKLLASFYKADKNSPWQLALLPLEGGEPLKLFNLPRSAFMSLKWMPDGKAICYRDWVSGVWKQDLDSDTPVKLAGLPEHEILPFGWSRDEKLFAFTRGRTVSDAVLISDSK